MNADVIDLAARRDLRRPLAAYGEPVAAWRTPSGMLLPAAAIVGAPPAGVTPVSTAELAPPHEDLALPPAPGQRHPAADVWAHRPPIRSADIVTPQPPSWWRAWLASVRRDPCAHALLFASIGVLVGTLRFAWILGRGAA